jgi:hypothetical protein
MVPANVYKVKVGFLKKRVFWKKRDTASTWANVYAGIVPIESGQF